MAIVDTNFPSRIELFHNRDGSLADWNVLVEDFSATLTQDSDDPLSYADRNFIELHVGGESAVVGEFYTDGDRYFDWYTSDQEGTWDLQGDRDDDSSRIVAQHDATVYDGLPPGEGEWVVRHTDGWRSKGVVHREPVTVVPRWVSSGVLSLQNCSASVDTLLAGEQVTLSATIDNPGYDPLAGDAVAFVGGSEKAIPFEVPPRGEVSVEATFQTTESGTGTLEYGFDLENVGHNY